MRFVSVLRRRGGDLVVLGLAAGMQAESWAGSASAPRALFLVAALGSLPLLARRRYPFVAPLCVPVAAVVVSFVAPEVLEESVSWIITVIVAMWSLGLGNERSRAVAAGVLAFGCAQVLNRNFSGEILASDVIFTLLLIWGPLLAGQVVRTRDERSAALRRRAEQLVQEREEQARAAVTEERARIARELHDVVAHSISVMTIQAGAARLVLDDEPARAEAPLRAVEETGRQTLAEMRRLLGVLDLEGNGASLSPQPGLGERLPSQGRPAGAARRGRPHRQRGRGAARPQDHAAARRAVREPPSAGPEGPTATRRADRPGARGAEADREGPVERRDREGAVPRRGDREPT